MFSLWDALAEGGPTVGSLPSLPGSYKELARLTGRDVAFLKTMSKANLKQLPLVAESAVAPSAELWPTIGSIKPLPATYSEMAFITGKAMATLKSMPKAELRKLRVVAVGDLRPRPSSFTFVSAITGVSLERIRAMDKEAMKRLPVVRRAEDAGSAAGLPSSSALDITTASWADAFAKPAAAPPVRQHVAPAFVSSAPPPHAARPTSPSDPFASLGAASFSPQAQRAQPATLGGAAKAARSTAAKAARSTAAKAARSTAAKAARSAAAAPKSTAAKSTAPAPAPRATATAAPLPAAAVSVAAVAAPGAAASPPTPIDRQEQRKQQLREKLRAKRTALAAEKSRMANVQHELKLLEKPIRPEVTRCRVEIERLETELHEMRASFKGVKQEWRRCVVLNEERRAEKARLTEHLTLILTQNEKTKDEILVSLEDQLEGAATHGEQSVQWTSVLRLAKKRLKQARATTHVIKTTHDVRFGPVAKGVAFAWSFSVKSGALVNYTPKFFRSSSCLQTSCALQKQCDGDSGTYVAPEDGVLVLEFDNTFSWFANKSVTLKCAASVDIVKPEKSDTARNAVAVAGGPSASSSSNGTGAAAAAAAAAAAPPAVTPVARPAYAPNTIGALPTLPGKYREVARLTGRSVSDLKVMSERVLKALPIVVPAPAKNEEEEERTSAAAATAPAPEAVLKEEEEGGAPAATATPTALEAVLKTEEEGRAPAAPAQAPAALSEAEHSAPRTATAACAAAATAALAPAGPRAAFVAERIALAEAMQQRALITEGDVATVRARLGVVA